MAPKTCFMSFVVILLALPLCFQTSFGEEEGVTCERMSVDTCAFAVSWSGKRCVLERNVKMRSGIESYVCRTSEIQAGEMVKKNTIESDHCVESCGLERKTLGISSDSLFDWRFNRKLCSPQCYLRCPNVVDLYFNVAAGEGVFLPKLCAAQKQSLRRSMSENLSSRTVSLAFPPRAPGPASAAEAADATQRSSFALAPESAEPVATADFTKRSFFGLAPESAEPVDLVERSELGVAPEPAEPIEDADPFESSSLSLAPESAESVENADPFESSSLSLAPESADSVRNSDFTERALFELAPAAAEAIKTPDTKERSLFELTPKLTKAIETVVFNERFLIESAPEPAVAAEAADLN